MALQYSTPGVYIEELDAFPHSIVEVPTAIPAFIGYTEFATDENGKPLAGVPYPIQSQSDFETYFGVGFETNFTVTTSTPTSPTQPLVATITPNNNHRFYLYDAIRLFYANGGGLCYIISIGTYIDPTTNLVATISSSDLIRPLTPATSTDKDRSIGTLYKLTDVTLIVIPDVMGVPPDPNGVPDYSVYQTVLQHCSDVQSRMGIFDVNQPQPVDPSFNALNTLINDGTVGFRTLVSTNFPNYGAAYFPWLKSTIITTSEVDLNNISPDARTNSAAFISLFTDPKNTNDQVSNIVTSFINAPAIKSLAAQENVAAMQAALTTANTTLATANAVVPPVANDVNNATAAVQTATTNLANAKKAFAADPFVNASASVKAAQAVLANANTTLANDTAALAKANAAAPKVPATIAAITAQIALDNQAVTAATKALANAQSGFIIDPTTDPSVLAAYRICHLSLIASSQIYSTIIDSITETLSELPPSGAIAGVYTTIDNTRGVWKAPANVAINSVTAPSVDLDRNMTDNLNVDAIGGKSINAIRSFPGIGTLVFGGRTLDGNSQDWRYISVRRTLIMMEQSIKLALRAYVFEPNDDNTWITVKSMITNFLTNLWKQGALAGAKPEDAFQVMCGLNVTMTAQDILDGYMRVTVLVAVVHPAEFIVLTFQQELQTS